MDGLENHASRGTVAADQFGGEEPVHDRHVDVEQRDVGLLRENEVDGLAAVGGLSDNLEGRHELEQGVKQEARRLMVVADHDTN